MLWMLLSFLLLLVLIGTNFVNLKFLSSDKKPYLMALIVVFLLLLCIVDQLTIPLEEQPIDNQLIENHQEIDKEMPSLNVSSDLYWNFPPRAIIKEQRMLVDYLGQLHKNGDATIMLIKEIDIIRFRALFKEFQKTKEGQPKKNAIFLDFGLYNYEMADLNNVLSSRIHEITYLIPTNIQSLNHFQALQLIYHHFNVSIILINIPTLLFPFSSLYKYTTIYNFNNNWVSQVLQNHPPKIVQLCNKYRNIDYKFYLLSQSEPLSDLCSKLPTSELTNCIREKLPEDASSQTGVPFSKVRHCWKSGSGYAEGVVIDNGIVSLKKDYLNHGKISEQLFLQQQYSNQNL